MATEPPLFLLYFIGLYPSKVCECGYSCATEKNSGLGHPKKQVHHRRPEDLCSPLSQKFFETSSCDFFLYLGLQLSLCIIEMMFCVC